MVLEDRGTCHEVVIATVPTVLAMASQVPDREFFLASYSISFENCPFDSWIVRHISITGSAPKLSGTYTDQLDHTSSLFCHHLCH